MTRGSFRLSSIVSVAISVGAAALLLRFRPEWPEQLPASLSTPLTTTLMRELAPVFAWLLGLLITALLLVEGLRTTRAHQRVDPDTMSQQATPERAHRSAYGRRANPKPPVEQPQLLVVPRPATPAPLTDEPTTGRRAKPPCATEIDQRPLVSLLGPLSIVGGKRSLRGLRARALELIALLALRGQKLQRDEILEALWPGEDPKRTRHRLYQAVRDARSLIGNAVGSHRDRYWLDNSQVRIDIDEFERLLANAEDAPATDRQQLLERALSCVRGDPLAGSDYRWAHSEIRRLRAAIVNLLERLGQIRLDAGDNAKALALAERALEFDFLNEPAHRLAMQAEATLGLREAVVTRYHRLTEVLDERLGLEPKRETRTLYLELLGQS